MSTRFIAEVASSHGGSDQQIQNFITHFAPLADRLKFQLTRHKHLSPQDPQLDWFRKSELNYGKAAMVIQRCHDAGVTPLFTVYEEDGLADLLRLGLKEVKVGSGEAHSKKFAEKILFHGFERIFVSEGIRPAAEAYTYDPRVVLFACISRYPAPHGLVASRLATGRYQGWSDHCIGINDCMAAIHLGAEWIEKHVQIATQARPPQAWEATAYEFGQLKAWAAQNPDRFLGRWSANSSL